MKLPNASGAIIEPAKLRDYLLSPAHPVGRFKAPFFVALGYSTRSMAAAGGGPSYPAPLAGGSTGSGIAVRSEVRHSRYPDGAERPLG